MFNAKTTSLQKRHNAQRSLSLTDQQDLSTCNSKTDIFKLDDDSLHSARKHSSSSMPGIIDRIKDKHISYVKKQPTTENISLEQKDLNTDNKRRISTENILLTSSIAMLDLNVMKVDHVENYNQKDCIRSTIERGNSNQNVQSVFHAWETDSCCGSPTMRVNNNGKDGFFNSEVQQTQKETRDDNRHRKHSSNSISLTLENVVKTPKITSLLNRTNTSCLTSPHLDTQVKERTVCPPMPSKINRHDNRVTMKGNEDISNAITMRTENKITLDLNSELGNINHRPNSAHSALELQIVEDRPLSRQCISNRYHEDKTTSIEDLRGRLKRRLRSRKKAGITTDPVFQKQMSSGFWTAEVLYHQWANNLLGL